MFELYDHFRFLRLVFINSAGAAHVELPLTETGLLLGRNNIGKTSGISSLKLFVLPEVNFEGCEKKFGFISKGEYYSSHASHSYYFPDDRSFIICEVENPKGRFCMILHRSDSQWGYARIAVPVAYDEIKDLFWDYNPECNDGFGRNRDNLSLKYIKQALKPFHPEFLTRPDIIREAIYTRPGPVDDLSRYCMVPLPLKGEKREVEVLRSLMSLAFQISGEKQLAAAVASIIETENAGKDGRMSVDILEINQEYEALKWAGERLRKIKNNFSVWGRLEEAYRDYVQDRKQILDNLEVLATNSQLLKEKLDEKFSQLASEREVLVKEKSQIDPAYSAAKDEANRIRNQIKLRKTDYKNKIDEIELANQALNKHKPIPGIESMNDVIRYLKGSLSEIEEDINACNERDGAVVKFQELTRKSNALSHEKEALERSSEQLSRCTLEALSHHGRSILYSLNKSLGGVTTPMNDEQLKIAERFSELFSTENGSIFFLDERLDNTLFRPFNPDQVRRDRQDRISSLSQGILDIQERMRKLKAIGEGQTSSVEDLKTEMIETKRTIEIASAYDHIKTEVENLDIEIAALEEQLPTAEDAEGELLDQKSSIMLSLKSIEQRDETLREQRNQHNDAAANLDYTMNSLKAGFADSALCIPATSTSAEPSMDATAFVKSASEFRDLGARLQQHKNHILRNMDELFRLELLQDEGSISYKTDIDFHEVRTEFEKFRAIFHNYEDNLRKHHADIESHNNRAGVRAQAIDTIGNMIDAFRRSMNASFSTCAISNLSAVEIVVEVDERFQTLRTDLNNTNFSGNQLLSDSVYQRLNHFCDTFFKSAKAKGKVVSLEKIITKVRYEVYISGKKANAQQSTGTSGMISTVLLALLLKRMVPSAVKLHFPIIFDEVSNLDSINLCTINRVVDEHDFILFALTPDNTGALANSIGNWYDLSLHSLSEGWVIEGCHNLFFDLAEGIKDESVQNAEVTA